MLQIFESEAEKVRREKAELKKALSCSRTSLDSGHFSIEKPVPPVDPESFNDGGDCVLDGNVSSQIKVSKNVLPIILVTCPASIILNILSKRLLAQIACSSFGADAFEYCLFVDMFIL